MNRILGGARVVAALVAATALAATTLVATTTAPAHAVSDGWAAWDPVAGTSNAYSTTLRPASAGFPTAAVATDSRGNVQLPGGSSTFLGADTPPGAKYGSSRDQRYLVLRPRADTPTAPSTTTYTFDQPTPDIGWAFVLGDVDADQVRVSAVDAAGSTVPAGEIDSWFRGTFNHSGGSDQPRWDAATSTLVGNPGAVDTDGASGWFEPEVRLRSLTLTFTRRAGFPVYQTWFVSRARPIGGTVEDRSTAGSCPVTGSTLTLLSPFGEELATTSPAADGTYELGEFATQSGYTVRLDAAPGCAVVGPAQATVSNVGNDGDPASRARFEVRAVVPFPISGTVRDTDGAPVAGVTVTLAQPTGGTLTTTTRADGTYLFDDNDTGDGYAISIGVPAGYVAGPDGDTIDDVDVTNGPVVDQDFVVDALPTVSGTVTGGGRGLGGVPVRLVPADGGPAITRVTDGDGGYRVDGVPGGTYTLEVEAPDGYTAPPARSLTVGADDLEDQDVALSRPGAVGGRVVGPDDEPVGGVGLTVSGGNEDVAAVTDEDGGWFVDGLDAGTYEVTVSPADGTVVDGPATATATITAAGEIVGGLDFRLAPAPDPVDPTDPPTDPVEPTDPTDPTDPPATGGPGTGGTGGTGTGATGPGALPATGAPQRAVLLAGAATLLGGLSMLAAGHLRTRRRSA
ncbi:carboxypeptidase regulatory-like domain-containing protein [Nocardioides zeae]|uniref:alpha-amylase n=1 Tax=Nocardioides imazamoxiresistens TaxID=3231893 RepID=A0ABU3PWE2_9ACTN|nr:carboxypeptidase regulatory-like domain-containing protein [Nocardioides zeae]MDT9593070.1 carboxypeptidase regulatory-like domain-containing protein [Nocardioides zeae]